MKKKSYTTDISFLYVEDTFVAGKNSHQSVGELPDGRHLF